MAVKILPDPVEPGINTATHVEAPLLGKVDGKNIYLDLNTNIGGYSLWSLKGMFDGDIAEVCFVMLHTLPPPANHTFPRRLH